MPKSRRPAYRRPNPLLAIKLRGPVWAALAGVLLLAVGGFATAATLEEQNSFCAACHTQPESTFYQRTQTVAVDLAAKHAAAWATRCIDCHSGPGLSGRIGAMTLGARDLAAFVTRTDQQPAPLTLPIGDANCLKCHAGVPATQSFNQHFHAFLARWQSLDANAGTCMSCHAAHATDGDPAQGFLQQERTQQVCDSCHAANVGRG
jgi:predicted CXXCH cytochrome family protein